jgi:hypothetical protein
MIVPIYAKVSPDVTCERLSAEVFALDGVITETPD